MKGCILPFPKKGDLRLVKNYQGKTLTSIAAKIYNTLLRNHIEPKLTTYFGRTKMASREIDPLRNCREPKTDYILWKNQNGFLRNSSMTTQILTIRQILEGVCSKNLQATILFVDFTKAFDSIHRGKMEQILLPYSLPKKAVAPIMMLYRNTKVKVRSPDGDTDYFNIVVGVLLGDSLAPYLFIICLDYVLRTSINKIKENDFKLIKERSRRYPAKTIAAAENIHKIFKGIQAKNLQATILFVNFTKAFDSIHRGKMEQILLAYGIPKENITAITIVF